MQQAAKKLLEGKGLNTYDYSYGDSNPKSFRHRNNVHDNDDSYAFTDDEDDNEDNNSNNDEYDSNDYDEDENIFNKREDNTSANKKFTLFKRDLQTDNDLNRID